MKVGQILSYMEVGLPEQTVARLARLQHGVTPLSLPVIQAVLEAELGAPLPELFERRLSKRGGVWYRISPISGCAVCSEGNLLRSEGSSKDSDDPGPPTPAIPHG
jgi:hypothetical protein